MPGQQQSWQPPDWSGLSPRLTEADKFNEMTESLGLTFIAPMTQNSYMPAFMIGAALAVLAVASVWLLIPTIKPLKPKSA